MTEADLTPPQTFDNATIVDRYDLSFDPGDALNGSLYLATPRAARNTVDAAISALREAGLWSAETVKQVGDDQREAYKAGLKFVDAVAYKQADSHFLLARFDHPKFPSDATRWTAWLAFFDARYERCG